MKIETVKKALIYCRPTQKSFDNVKRTFQSVCAELRKHDVEIVLQERLAKCVNGRGSFKRIDCGGVLSVGGDIDVVISIGGDGAFIHSTAVAKRFDVPVLGINAGTLGFLTAYSKKEVRVAIAALMKGLLTSEKRQRIYCEHYRNGSKLGDYDVFNDIIIKTGAVPRLLDLGVTVGGKSVVRYKSDGVIVCTPSGSTAYNMAGGGSILSPEAEVFGVTPICANGLTNRAMVFGDSQEIDVEFLGSDESEAILVADGVSECNLQVGDKVVIKKSEVPSWVVPSDENVFAVMNEKLGWDRR